VSVLGESMHARLAGLALLAAMLLGSGPAVADDEFARKGVYAGAGGVFAIEEFGDGADDPYAGGFDLTLSYRASEVLSVETEFEWVGNWERTVVGEADTKINMYAWSANVKGNVPLGRISPYGTIGFGFYRVRYSRGMDSLPPPEDDIDAMMLAAVGVDFYLTKNLVLSPEWSYNFLFNGTASLDYMGVTGRLTYRF